MSAHTKIYLPGLCAGADQNTPVYILGTDDGSGGMTITLGATLATGDIEIGAVEIKNSVTDDRVLIAATNATPTFGLATLPALANAAAPSHTEAKLVYESVDLSGNRRVILNAETTKVIGTINLAAAQTLATVTTVGTVTTLTQWTAGTLVIGTGANVIGAVTQSGTWNVGTVTTVTGVTTVSTVTSLSQFGGFAINLGSGAASTGTLRIIQATDSPEFGVALTPSAAVQTTQRPAVTQVVSTALEASHVLKASAGQLVQLSIFNSKASAQFALVMNSTTVPGDGAVTLLYPPIPLPAATLVVVDLPAPLVASTGIAVCNSSTGTFTKTIGSADCVFYAQVN